MDVTQGSIVHNIALVLLLLWIFGALGWSHPVVFFLSLLYLYAVNERYSLRLRRRLQHEERRYASQRRLLSDSESVRWLNHAIKKIWPICMEQIASQQLLLPIIPWFLDKYKPWTARKTVVQHLYLGRSPPMVTGIRVLGESSDDDHLVLELGINFLSADDMSAILEVQLRKTLGFGIRTKLHVTSMHVEGKVLVGVKFLPHWPFLGRVRVCFVEPPYFQMTIKPIFTHGVDVTELPGIAGWLDNLLALAFEQTLVEPNMLVVDVEKFVSTPEEEWFTVDEKPPIAFVKLEIVEAADMNPSDMNGLADPYVKGQLGPYRFRTKVQKKTLAPKWFEEFRIPICSWEAPNVLILEVRDKDHIFDDTMGDCSITLGDLRGGQRHEKWLPLNNIKKGRLHLAITVLEGEHEKEKGDTIADEELSPETSTHDFGSVSQNSKNADASIKESQNMADEFEPIIIEGQVKTGIWVHHPGREVPKTWEPRKGRVRRPEIKLLTEDIDCNDSPRSASSGSYHSETNISSDHADGTKGHKRGIVGKGLRKIGLIFNRSPKNQHPKKHRAKSVLTPHANLRAVGEKGISVNLIVDDRCAGDIGGQEADRDDQILQKAKEESYRKGFVEVPSHKMDDFSPRNYKTKLSRNELNNLKPPQAENTDSSKEIPEDKPRLSTTDKAPIETLSISGQDQDSGNGKSHNTLISLGDAKEPNHDEADVKVDPEKSN